MIKTEIKNDITVLCFIFLNNNCLISARLIQIHVNERKSVQCKTQTADPKNSSPQSVCNLHCRKECIMGNPCAVHPLQNTVFSLCKESRVCRDKSEKTVDVFRALRNRKEKCDITLPS